ncbi:Phage terminase-like protein, large subunit, contains N-terminal HTH domain [Sphingomonas laterariae]|uniref:Phage terminase-like protein, large subunit, contains N-terminal HTH domain n=1 Tax=Edaphosphingomonas laterariae TaxID=861865 RepID=A0A239FBG6_9SPHN|nr:terminase large subunit [Sphingomonas laterariae]SNS53434.1 Phage terminase-like protein, large subunit, contains N-terminal HTH domain [Sphingomonas laterariae]
MEQPGPALGWDFSCPDWEARLREGRSLLPDLPLDEEEAARAVAIFNKLRLPDVPGQPLLADAAGDWARDIVRAIFGSLDEHGERQVREVFDLVPKKNAKTTNGAAIMMTALLMNERPRAEFVLIGPTQEIADIAFQQASGMIDADPYLKTRFHVQEHVKTIVDRVNKAKLKVKTFDMKVATGSKPAGILIDEVHLMSSISYASRVIGQLRGGMIANPEAFLIMITTQSDEPPAGVFKAELDYARGVRDGRIKTDVHMLPMLYEFSEAMQRAKDKPWRDPRNWHMVLPNLGRSITIDRLIAEYRTACAKGDEEERRWASQHLNVQIGMALHTDRWVGVDYWEDAADETISLDELIERSEVIVAGIDGGGLDDLLGLALLGRCKVTRDWLLWNRAWAHDDVFKRRKDIVERLDDFVRLGQLVRCEDPTSDIVGVADVIERIAEAGLFPEKAAIGLDPQGVAALVDELASRGIVAEQMIGIAQGFRLSSAVWGMERKLKDGTLWHAGQAMMAWCVGNARAEQRGNAVLITKEQAGKAKIDPLCASFNAVMLMSRNPTGRGGGLDDYLASLAG